MCTTTTEIIQNNKETKNSRSCREILSRIFAYHRSTENPSQGINSVVIKHNAVSIYYSDKKKKHTVKTPTDG